MKKVKTREFLRIVPGIIALLVIGAVLTGCPTDVGGKTTTSVTFNGQRVPFRFHEFTDNEVDGWRWVEMGWKNEFQNKTDQFNITIGDDILQHRQSYFVISLSDMEGKGVISEADYNMLVDRFNDALIPLLSDRWMRFGRVENPDRYVVTVVQNYAAMLRDAVLKLVQAPKGNIGRA